MSREAIEKQLEAVDARLSKFEDRFFDMKKDDANREFVRESIVHYRREASRLREKYFELPALPDVVELEKPDWLPPNEFLDSADAQPSEDAPSKPLSAVDAPRAKAAAKAKPSPRTLDEDLEEREGTNG